MMSSALPSSRIFSARARRVCAGEVPRLATRVLRRGRVRVLRGMVRTSELSSLWGADGRCRAGIELHRQEDPSRRREPRQASRRRHDSGSGKSLGGKLGQGPATIGRAREDRNGKPGEDRAPPPPMANLREIVGAHQPHKTLARINRLERRDRVGGVARSDRLLDCEHANTRVTGEGGGCGETRR